MKRFLKQFICLMLCIISCITFTLSDIKIVEASTSKLDKTELTLNPGMTNALKVTGTSSKNIKWSSSDKKIATVSNTGKVTALSKGTATITASVDSKKLICNVTVKGVISKNWKDYVLIIDGELYKLSFDYKQLQAAGWDFNLSDYGYDSYTMKPGERLDCIFKLKHSEYDADIVVGFINTDKKAKAIKDCKIWYIYINNRYAKKPVPFVLPGGVKSGSKAIDVLDAYNDPDYKEKSDFGFWIYDYIISYSDDDTDYEWTPLELIIDDEKGLVEVSYKFFEK